MAESTENTRQLKVAREIQRDLAEIIRGRGMAAFDGAMVTVSGVKMSPDLSLAKVYVSIFPSSKTEKVMEILEEKLKTSENVKFIYTIPNFQNPSGCTMSLEKRKKLYELAKKYGVLILEDNPYGDLRVTGEDVPTIKSFDEDGIVIYAGSFSKVLAPGIRAGYVIAPKEIISKMTVGKQAADTHSTMFTQILVDEWMKQTDMSEHIAKIQAIYRRKLNLMCDLIDEYWGDFVKYVRPEGGLFVWCELPENVNMLEFAAKCVENKVAVVPGNAFIVEPDEKTNCIRLNFSTPSDEKIVEGMKILKKVKELYV